MENSINILTAVVGIVVTLTCIAAVPFAIRVTRELAEIRGDLKASVWQAEAIEKLRQEVAELKIWKAGKEGSE